MASTSASAAQQQIRYNSAHNRNQHSMPPHLNPHLTAADRQIQLNRYIAEKLSPFAATQQYPGNAARQSQSESGSSAPLKRSRSQRASAAGQGHPAVIATTQQQPTQGQLDYLHWLRQCQLLQWEYENRLHIPWYLWATGVMDIVAGFGGLIYTAYDPPMYTWVLVMSYIGEVVKFVMGIGLLIGLTKKSPIDMYFYCKLWLVCQVFFVGQSVVNFVVVMLQQNNGMSSKTQMKMDILGNTATRVFVFFIRIVQLWLVYVFTKKVKAHIITREMGPGLDVESGMIARDQDQQQQGRRIEVGQPRKFGTGELAYSIPSTGLMMPM